MRITVFISLVVVAALAAGCSRTKYRTAADRDVYGIVREKSAYLSEPVPSNFTIRPDARSRFFDPTNPDCPQLPTPKPVLYGYELPPLRTLTAKVDAATSGSKDAETAERFAEAPTEAERGRETLSSKRETPSSKRETPSSKRETPSSKVVQASFSDQTSEQETSQPEASAQQETLENAPAGESESTESGSTPPTDNDNAPSTGSIANRVIIPQQAWSVLPQTCLDRMFEFESLRTEYRQSFPESDEELISSKVQPLALPQLMELAMINSREFQTRKETLYRAALILTRQRYQFELNPSPFGNGTAANYRHSNNAGITNNTLGVPSGVGVERTLATGGEFLARFANSVVLTFNGPSGFATDISSEMIFDFQQTVFQRDIRFELLTQSERDVIYAAREYVRFRKQLFRDIANQYYNLLLSYRGIEINAQDYFTNLRGFIQSQAEYRTAEKIPRIQVDQFEQNVLRTRSNLVNNCFALEAALDQLKFRIGLPTEMVIVVDLSELESISLRDELSVARQMINRARTELITTKKLSTVDSTTLANVAEVLADRMSTILDLQLKIEEKGEAEPAVDPSEQQQRTEAILVASQELKQLQQQLQVLGVRMQVDILKAELNSQMSSKVPAPPLRILIRAVEFCSSELQVIDLALASNQLANDPVLRASIQDMREQYAGRLRDLTEFLDQISDGLKSGVDLTSISLFEEIPKRQTDAIQLVQSMERLANQATETMIQRNGESMESILASTVDQTIQLSDRLLANGPDGWEEIVLDHDEALLTGLVQRLDLMNQRGELADFWRRIKLAGDDLKSIVDLRATQILGTKTGSSNPFDFSLDDSETRLSVALDTPLNRRLQRNNFRSALINYNAGLRNLIAAEDSIKLDIREDLRQLALDRNQYTIAVASAALAYERVISTRMRLQLAVQNVAARDFLEAQQAYTNALSTIARQHVNYILDRTELFFDLEAFDVDANGYWGGVREDFGPGVNMDFPGTNPRPYDTLPPNVRYSPTIRQMEAIGPGEAEIGSSGNPSVR
ncbi:TolC family protein [Pirellulaceae bacterium SH501]